MQVDAADVHQSQVMPVETAIERGHGEVTEMLVVNRVKLALIEERLDVWHLDDRPAIILEQRANPGNETVEVRHVGQNVVSVKEVGARSLARKRLSQFPAEKFAESRNPILFLGH